MYTLNLTEEESQTLLQLLDVAVKAGGLPAAQAAIHIQTKITKVDSPEPVESKS